MQHSFSRRDFLKVAGLGLGALAFKPIDFSARQYESLYAPKRLPQFPNAEIIGRVVTTGVNLRSRPTDDPNLSVTTPIAPDDLFEWNREVVGNVVITQGLVNQNYVETPRGYIYGSVLQPTRNLPNVPITEIPPGQTGFWAEVTVPYVDLTLDSPAYSPWMQSNIEYNFPPRAYYSQVLWIDQIRQTNGFVEYRWNESPNGHGYGFGDIYWADGAAFKVLTEADVAPISPDIDPAEKTIIADLTYQTLSAFEGNREVFFCRISSGLTIDLSTGLLSNERATPIGNLLTHWKIISLNMSGGGFAAGWSTPAVPWSTVISGGGIAIHGAFWHNAFGERRSHGCINVRPEDAKWLFRWTTPHVSLAQSEIRITLPDHGTIVTTTELKV